MKMSLTSTTMFTVGAVLMWAAVKDQDPRTLVKNALQGKPTGDNVVTFPGGKIGGKIPTPPAAKPQQKKAGPKLVIPYTPLQP